MDNKITVKFKKLHPDAVIPKYAHDGDVCMDLTAISVEYDADKDMYIYHTGLAFESDFNVGQFLFVRSSNRKTDAYLCNHVGIADSAIYRGEIMLCFKNRTSLEVRRFMNEINTFFNQLNTYGIHDISSLKFAQILMEKEMKKVSDPLLYAPYKVGDRVAQMVFIQYPTVELVEVDELSSSDRGERGFGSTGN